MQQHGLTTNHEIMKDYFDNSQTAYNGSNPRTLFQQNLESMSQGLVSLCFSKKLYIILYIHINSSLFKSYLKTSTLKFIYQLMLPNITSIQTDFYSISRQPIEHNYIYKYILGIQVQNKYTHSLGGNLPIFLTLSFSPINASFNSI